MDDYAKILLQLAFPFHLILIAFVLIIGSRYSAKIHKFTPRRALPVLSTLFHKNLTDGVSSFVSLHKGHSISQQGQ